MILYSDSPAIELAKVLEAMHPQGVFVIIPQQLREILLPQIADGLPDNTTFLPIIDDERHKTLAAATDLWEKLIEKGATRQSVTINIGGGLTTDLGGFVAACYMRGIRYINIPTSLLAMIDAASGGKTAVNLAGTKNLIGAFHAPECTLISPRFLASLPERQLLSGIGEMLKHALLKGPEALSEFLATEPHTLLSAPEAVGLIRESVAVKEEIVAADPREQGLRRVLNLGHTFGHALEALSYHEPIAPEPLTHGHAVAIGLVCALVLSCEKCDFPSAILHKVAAYIREHYPPVSLDCRYYDVLLRSMSRDKKNPSPSFISFTLLRAPGQPVQSVTIDNDEIKNAIDITRDLLGL